VTHESRDTVDVLDGHEEFPFRLCLIDGSGPIDEEKQQLLDTPVDPLCQNLAGLGYQQSKKAYLFLVQENFDKRDKKRHR
jgi:hypothetical protein